MVNAAPIPMRKSASQNEFCVVRMVSEFPARTDLPETSV